jgi:hypothetical protein
MIVTFRHHDDNPRVRVVEHTSIGSSWHDIKIDADRTRNDDGLTCEITAYGD